MNLRESVQKTLKTYFLKYFTKFNFVNQYFDNKQKKKRELSKILL